MSRSERTRPIRAVLAVGTVIAALALAGCGAGQVTATSDQATSSGGANIGTGPVLVRDAEIEFSGTPDAGFVYPAGGSAPLHMRIINQGPTADRLVSATSRAAGAVQIGGMTTLPSGEVLVVGGQPPLLPGTWATQLTLTGLREQVRSGLTYDLMLTFEHAGALHFDIPVGNPTTPREPASE